MAGAALFLLAMVEGMDPQQVKYMTDKIPMKRCAARDLLSETCSLCSILLDPHSCGTIDEVASIASWIVSKEASFNTGVCFDLTGGRATY